MPTRHVVQQGECLVSLAIRYGFRSTDDLLGAPGNAYLSETREDPTVLAPGDVVEIPDLEPKHVTRLTEQRHRFRVILPRVEVTLAIRDEDGAPQADVRYRLVVGHETFEGRTGSDGLIRHPVARQAERGVLAVWLPGHEDCEPLEWEVALGHLDPPDLVSGAQARLASLGYYRGPIDGRLRRRTRAALARFQRANDLPETGDLDDETATRLRQARGH